jgi:hypothetical protein
LNRKVEIIEKAAADEAVRKELVNGKEDLPVLPEEHHGDKADQRLIRL